LELHRRPPEVGGTSGSLDGIVKEIDQEEHAAFGLTDEVFWFLVKTSSLVLFP